MNFHKLYGKPIAYFSKKELEQLYKDGQLPALKEEMKKQGISMDDLRSDLKNNDLRRYRELADAVGQKVAQGSDHEIFAGWNIFLSFYEQGSEVCFELKNSFIVGRSQISTLDDLNKFRDDVFGDFIIKSADGLRVFQLKRYRGLLDAQAVGRFIKDKLNEYGKSIGDTNLLLILQSHDNDLDKLDFSALHQFLKRSGLEIKGQILIAFNANNKTSVVVQVYPEHAVAKIPIQWASDQTPDPNPRS